MSDGRHPPFVCEPEREPRPHCGRCGVPYVVRGGWYADEAERQRMVNYYPRCTCWTLAPEAREGESR